MTAQRLTFAVGEFEADDDGSKEELGDRHTSKNIPLKVKNTFIDVDGEGELDIEGNAYEDAFKKRQVSEPVPGTSTLGARNRYAHAFNAFHAGGDLAEAQRTVLSGAVGAVDALGLGPHGFEAEDGSRDDRLGSPNFPLKVKNTLIDVDGEEENIEDVAHEDGFGQRQVSDPVAGASALGVRNRYPPVFDAFAGGSDFADAQRGDSLGYAPRGSQVKSRGRGHKGLGVSFPLDEEPPEPMMVRPGATTSLAAAAMAAASGGGAGDPQADMAMALHEGVDVPPVPSVAPPADWASTTTVMMRNIPNKYTQRMLLTEINHTGFLGTFDFLYLPIDPETAANRGYSFVNFIDPGFAWMFKVTYEGRKMNRFNSNKVVSVTPATLQGFEANYAHYATARVNRGDPASRPLFLREPKQTVQDVNGRGGAGGVRRGSRKRGGGASSLDQLAAQQVLQAQAHEASSSRPGFAWPGSGVVNTYFGLDGRPSGEGFEEDIGVAPSPVPMPKSSAPASKFVPKFCPHCGSPIQPHFQFCPSCGGSLDFGGGLRASGGDWQEPAWN